MTSYLNPSANASAGPTIKDPDYHGGAKERTRLIAGTHQMLSGALGQDYTGNLRRWALKWTGLTNAQWTTVKAYLQGGYQLYWQGPEMSTKVAVVTEEAREDPVHMNGDTAAAPHWNVSLTVREGTLANAVPYVFGSATITLGAVTLSAAGTVTGTILVYDQFTDANGTALTAHTIAPTNVPGTSWTSIKGAWEIQSNAAVSKTYVAAEAIAVLDSGTSDGTYSVDITAATNHGQAQVFRCQDSTHFWIHHFDELADTVNLYENNGGYTLRASVAKVITNGVTYAMQQVLSGTSITCTVDGGSSLSYTSSLFQTMTKHGVLDGGSGVVGQGSWDNFKVQG